MAAEPAVDAHCGQGHHILRCHQVAQATARIDALARRPGALRLQARQAVITMYIMVCGVSGGENVQPCAMYYCAPASSHAAENQNAFRKSAGLRLSESARELDYTRRALRSSGSGTPHSSSYAAGLHLGEAALKLHGVHYAAFELHGARRALCRSGRPASQSKRNGCPQ